MKQRCYCEKCQKAWTSITDAPLSGLELMRRILKDHQEISPDCDRGSRVIRLEDPVIEEAVNPEDVAVVVRSEPLDGK